MKKATFLVCAMAAGTVGAMATNAAKMHSSVAMPAKAENMASALSPVMTDAVLVDNNAKFSKKISTKATLSASYDRPASTYTLGVTESLGGFDDAYVFGPAYTPTTWVNQSRGASSYLWSFNDPSFERDDDGKVKVVTSTDKDLTLSYRWSSGIMAPTLTASDGVSSELFDPSADTFSSPVAYYMFGGHAEVETRTGTEEVGMTMYENMGKKNADGYKFSRGSIYSYNVGATTGFKANGTSTQWESFFSEENIGTDVAMQGFGMVFKKPASTYSITKTWAWLNVVATKATQLRATVYKLNDEGAMTEVLATGTANVAAGSSSAVTFKLSSLDEDGFEIEGPVNVNSAIMIVVTGFAGNDAITSVTPAFGLGNTYTAGTNSPYENHAINVLTYKDANNETQTGFFYAPWSYYTDSSRSELLAVSDYMFMVDASFWWMRPFASDGQTQLTSDKAIVLPSNGGSYPFYIASHDQYADWTYEVTYDSADEWLTFDGADEMESGQYIGLVDVTATAQALPAGTTSRSATVEFSAPGASCTLRFEQGEGGVADAVVDSNVSVVVAGDNFVVTASSDVNNAEVYNVAGQKVAEAAVAGNATIDASALANGVYIVKFNNGKAVKVVK